MKLVIVPGFLGYAQEPHHMDLVERAQIAGIEGIVVESRQLADNEFEHYKLSTHLEEVNKVLDSFDNEDIAIVGVSLGGVVACYACKGRPNVTRLACIVSPYKFGAGDDMESLIEDWKHMGKHAFVSSKYNSVDVPYSFVTDAVKYNALDIISEITCAKLFLAGSSDIRVSHLLTAKLASKSNHPKIYRLIQGMRHDYKNQPDFLKLVNDYVLEFIAG